MKRVNFEEIAELHVVPALPAPTMPYRRGLNPSLSPALSNILREVQRELGSSTSSEEGALVGERVLRELIDEVADRMGLELTSFERDEVQSQVEREQRPFSVLQELVDDSEVSDVIVHDYSHVSVQKNRRTFSTDAQFPSQEGYEAFVERLLQRAGSTYSTKKPVADGMIDGFARVHAVHKSICDSGPYLTIRLNRFGRVAVDDLVHSGTAPRALFEYLCGICQAGHTLMIVGEVGTGKTTLARAIAGAIPQEDSILVIEDTPEIRLEHSQTRYITTRESNTDGAGRIAPSECIRAGMRMAMNRIIFGEIRDAEAAEAFIDVCASGHPGLSTIHAKSAIDAITRLELFLGRAQRGVGREVLSQQIGTAVQVLVFVGICNQTGKRRIQEVVELGAVADGAVRHREIFRYESRNRIPAWQVKSKASLFRESLEALENPVYLHQMPGSLELDSHSSFRESVSR